MKTRNLLMSFFASLFLLSGAAFADTNTEATVTRVTGTATAKLADGSSQTIAEGMKLPQGAEITTGDASQVTIQAHEGIVAIAGAKTTITVDKLSVSDNGTRNATIALKSGNLASSLDPAKRNLNNYSVRTPKGVAAARGTTFSVAYDGVVYSVTVVAGVVQSFSATGASVNVNVGQVSSDSGSGATSQTMAEALTANPSMSDGLSLLAAAVASVSTNVADVTAVIGTIASSAGTSQAATNAIATATAAAASTAAMNTNLTDSGGGSTGVASSIVGAAVNGAASAGNTAAAGTIVATTTVAVSTTTGASVQSVATALTNTANNTAGVSVNTTNVVNAANASIQQGNTTFTTTAIVETTSGDTNVIEVPVTTPITPVDPTVVSPSGG